MSSKNGDMPASPQVGWTEDEAARDSNDAGGGGLTKREHFAGLAMQAYISGVLAWSDGLDGGAMSPSAEEAATEAVAYADALLKELEK